MKCEDCKWFKECDDCMSKSQRVVINGVPVDQSDLGECRKNPPTSGSGMPGPFGASSSFPRIRATDFCGAFDPKGA